MVQGAHTVAVQGKVNDKVTQGACDGASDLAWDSDYVRAVKINSRADGADVAKSVTTGISSKDGNSSSGDLSDVGGSERGGGDADGLIACARPVVLEPVQCIDPETDDFEWDDKAVAQLKAGKIKGCPVTHDGNGALVVELGAVWKGKTITCQRVDFSVRHPPDLRHRSDARTLLTPHARVVLTPLFDSLCCPHVHLVTMVLAVLFVQATTFKGTTGFQVTDTFNLSLVASWQCMRSWHGAGPRGGGGGGGGNRSYLLA